MSRRFLEGMSGSHGLLRDWLDDFEGEPRIAWYPSAGEDLRDILYLNPTFRSLPGYFDEEAISRFGLPQPPDLFLHTDYFPWSGSRFLDDRLAFADGRTRVEVMAAEELPRCDLPLARGIVHFRNGSQATGRVLFLLLRVHSNVLGQFTAPLLYAFSENAAFCHERMLPAAARASHIIHVRYGAGLGGGSSPGRFMLNVLDQLGCELYLSDGHLNYGRSEEPVYKHFPGLRGPEDISRFCQVGLIPGCQWSDHGDVSWNYLNRR